MGTTADKLNKLLDTKKAIMDTINSCGGVVTTDTPFADYPDAIRNLGSTFKFNYNSSAQVIDCSWQDIRAAIDNGQDVICQYDNSIILTLATVAGEGQFVFKGLGEWDEDNVLVSEYTVGISNMFEPAYCFHEIRTLQVIS